MCDNRGHGRAQGLAAHLARVYIDDDAPETLHCVVGRAVQIGAPLASNHGHSRRGQFRIVGRRDGLKPGDDHSTAVLAGAARRLVVCVGHDRTVDRAERKRTDLGRTALIAADPDGAGERTPHGPALVRGDLGRALLLGVSLMGRRLAQSR